MTANSVIRRGSPIRQAESTLEQAIIRGASEQGVKIIRENGRIHAKEASNCSRQSAFNAIHELIFGEIGTTDFSATSSFHMGIGTAIHDIVTGALEKQGRLLFAEYKLPESELNMGGKIDGIILDNGKIKVLEIKTCGPLPASVKPDHYAQAVAYSAILGVDTVVLYVSRNVQDYSGKLLIKPFDLYPSMDERRKIVMNLCLARIAINDQKLPPILFESSKSCEYCQYLSYCWGQETHRVDDYEYYGDARADLFFRAEQMANRLFDDIDVRRNGIFKHLSIHGTELARTLLSGSDWKSLI
jgi:CRISPR/Cas system-associated exonuclease Cas4 (RecB family)